MWGRREWACSTVSAIGNKLMLTGGRITLWSPPFGWWLRYEWKSNSSFVELKTRLGYLLWREVNHPTRTSRPLSSSLLSKEETFTCVSSSLLRTPLWVIWRFLIRALLACAVHSLYHWIIHKLIHLSSFQEHNQLILENVYQAKQYDADMMSSNLPNLS
jgi:hypothetical protein